MTLTNTVEPTADDPVVQATFRDVLLPALGRNPSCTIGHEVATLTLQFPSDTGRADLLALKAGFDRLTADAVTMRLYGELREAEAAVQSAEALLAAAQQRVRHATAALAPAPEE